MELKKYYMLDEEQKELLPYTIANQILLKVFTGELKHGERVKESNVAIALGVSNIPVRESFYILENLGVLERLPRKGVRVKEFTDKEFIAYTDALVELTWIILTYAQQLWTTEQIENLKQLAVEAKSSLNERNIVAYILDCDRILRLMTEVADNLAFKKMYNDISCITLTYCRVYWTDFNRLEERYESLLQTIEAIEKNDIEMAKEQVEIFIRKQEPSLYRYKKV